MALSFDPQKLPVLGVDDHLPPVAAGSLLTDSLRQRFIAPPVWSPEIKSEPRFVERAPAHASVLIALVPREALLPAQPLGQVGAHQREARLKGRQASRQPALAPRGRPIAGGLSHA